MNTLGSAELFNSRPNPATDVAEIPYSVSNDATNAQIVIYDASTGRMIKTYDISGQGNVTVTGLATGHYSYVLYVNGAKVASKTMIFAK